MDCTKEQLANQTMLNEIFARKVLQDTEVSEYVLRIIIDDKNLTITKNITQADDGNPYGGNAILDCRAKSGDGRDLNIEVQRVNKGETPKPSRFSNGFVNIYTLDTGEPFGESPETYVIFITEDVRLHRGLPLIRFLHRADEEGYNFDDCAHYIFVDADQNADTELGKLMHDFRCKNLDDMCDSILKNRVKVLKETGEGIEQLCREMDSNICNTRPDN